LLRERAAIRAARLKAAGQRGRALRPGGSAAAGGGREGSGAGDRLGAWLFDALLRWHRGFLDSLFELVAFVAEQRGKDRSLSIDREVDS